MGPNEKKALDKKLRKHTKAQLWEELRNMQVEKMALDGQFRELKECHAHQTINRDAVVSRNDELRARIDSLLEERSELEGKWDRLHEELREMTTDRDNWKHDYSVVLANYRRVKKDLYEQARLAGVLATEHDATLMNHER